MACPATGLYAFLLMDTLGGTSCCLMSQPTQYISNLTFRSVHIQSHIQVWLCCTKSGGHGTEVRSSFWQNNMIRQVKDHL